MANSITKKEMNINCPRCGSNQAHVMTYHFGVTYKAECASCSYGKNTTGDSENIVLARLKGFYLENPI